MECLDKLKCNKYIIFNDLSQAEAILTRFEENYTVIDTSSDGTQFALFIRPKDRHLLTQIERESMAELPNDFYTNIS